MNQWPAKNSKNLAVSVTGCQGNAAHADCTKSTSSCNYSLIFNQVGIICKISILSLIIFRMTMPLIYNLIVSSNNFFPLH